MNTSQNSTKPFVVISSKKVDYVNAKQENKHFFNTKISVAVDDLTNQYYWIKLNQHKPVGSDGSIDLSAYDIKVETKALTNGDVATFRTLTPKKLVS